MFKPNKIRVLVALAIVFAVMVGAFARAGVGTLSAFGLEPLSYICPLGWLETGLASRDLLPALWISITLVLLSIVFFGKYFCAWVCPTNLFGNTRRNDPPPPATANDERGASLSRYAILGGTLVSSFVFGFPVFCAICPIGLFFGALFAVKRLVFAQEPGWEIFLFPALLATELFVLKSWCRSICPLGALLSLAGHLNQFFRPTVNATACLAVKGTKCQACVNACPEGIDLRKKATISLLKDCTRCLECSNNCPVQAIHFPLRAAQ